MKTTKKTTKQAQTSRGLGYADRRAAGAHLSAAHLKGLKEAASSLSQLRRVTFDLDRDFDLLLAIHAVNAAVKFVERFQAE